MLAALIPEKLFIEYDFEMVPSQSFSLLQEVKSVNANREVAKRCFKFISSGFDDKGA